METPVINLEEVFHDLIDHLAPELTPNEVVLYLYLLRHATRKNDCLEVTVGKRTMADALGIGTRGAKHTYNQVSKFLEGLEQKGCITVGLTTRNGTLYQVVLPRDVPLVREKLARQHCPEDGGDYFSDPEKRREIVERDGWRCQYCGEQVTTENATLDHFIPQSQGGSNRKENLRTSCLLCNSVKSGKSYDEAAPLILKNIQERKKRERTS